MEPLQQSAAAARLPARLGQWCAAPQLLLRWSLYFLAALRDLSWCLAVALGASQAAMPRLVRQEEQAALQRLPKSTNPPTVLQRHPMCFALGRVTCFYSFIQTVWPFQQVAALQRGDNTLASIRSRSGPHPLSRALGLWKPCNISTAVYGSLRQQKKCWKTSQLWWLIVFPPFCAHQLPGMIQSVYGFLAQSSWLHHPPENTPQYSTAIYQFAAPRVDWANSFPVLASSHLQSKVKEKDKIFP